MESVCRANAWYSARKPSLRLFLGALTCALFLSFVTAAWGQAVNTGNLAGQVFDQQGAVLPGVKVTMTDPVNGTSYSAITNAEGRFFMANVPPSTYAVTASKAGFATSKVPSETIDVGTTTTLDLHMTVGEISTTVEVQASNIELQTMNATIGNTVPNVALQSLPAIGLDVSTFAVLQPGVTPDGNVAGTVGEQSTFMLDGGQNTSDMDGSMQTYTGGFAGDPSGGASTYYSYNQGSLPSGVVPTPADSVEEIKTNTTNQTADFNSSSGMQVQVVTKRGTNRWHGTAYEYYLDNNFSSNSWSNNCTTACGKSYTPLADWHRSWFGVAGGGPLISKKLLGGKTYFFANYQGSRWPLSVTNTKTVPGPGMLQGLLEFQNGNTISVYNLNPTAVVYSGPTLTGKCSSCGLISGVSYPVGISTVNGASINATPLDPRGLGINTANNPVSQMWNKYVPTLLANPQYDYSAGDASGNTFGYTGTEATPLSDNFGVARLDHDFGDKWHFFGSYRYYRLPNNSSTTQTDVGGFLPGDKAGVLTSVATNPQVPWFYVAGLTTNISPTTTNDFHYSFIRNWWAWGRAGDPAQLAGLGAALEPGGESASSLSPYNVNTQNTRTRYWDGLDHMFRDDVTSLHGNHLMQFGGSYQRNFDKHQRTDNGGGINYYPVYLTGYGSSTYDNPTAVFPSNLSSSNQNTYATEYNEILGIVNETQVAYTRSGPNLALLPPLTPAQDSSVIPFYNVYFSDSWHMKPSFTLTYGLSWTLEMPPYETQGRQINVVDSSGQPLDTIAYLGARKQAALNGLSYNPEIGFALDANTSGGVKYPYKPFYGEFSPRIAAAWNPDVSGGLLGRLFGGKNTVLRGGYSRIYGRLNGVDLVLVPLLAPGFIQPVQCFNPQTNGNCAGTGA
ncbi:MAG TPA: carboxypeptidase-like regulatory domain-containing protein, partial [Gemmataceae bacterium]|nr:carboxypeptidase-like regulatory domain-containing protein [Gemmataceae bacterium]